MALGLMLAVLRRIAESDRRLRSDERGFSREDLMGRELRSRTLGLVGMSVIGSRTAALGRAFGMRVLGSDPGLDAQEMARRGAEAVSFDELLRQSDIVSLHCPRNAHTLGLMNSARFAAMKPGAIFISTARSGIHDEVALAHALESGHLAGGAGRWDQEPPPPDAPAAGLAQCSGHVPYGRCDAGGAAQQRRACRYADHATAHDRPAARAAGQSAGCGRVRASALRPWV